MEEPTFYVNGEFVPASQAKLPVHDLGIVRGYGVFDALRTYDRVPFHLDDHLYRLQRSASMIDLELPWSRDELAALVDETLESNDFENATIRIVVTGGPSLDFGTPMGDPSLIIYVTPLSPPSPEQYANGRKVTTVKMTRERPEVKSLNYIGATMAVQAATKVDAVEALYVNERNQITEGTRSNFFVVRGKQLITPDDEVLAGITRQVVMKLAGEIIDVILQPIPLDELSHVDEAFITSSTKEILPIIQVDDQVIGNGRPGPVTLELLARFREYAQS